MADRVRRERVDAPFGKRVGAMVFAIQFAHGQGQLCGVSGASGQAEAMVDERRPRPDAHRPGVLRTFD